MRKAVVLGDEFDERLTARLIEKLKSSGAIPLSSDWSLVGSQELRTLSALVGSEVVEISSETFVGLSISGPEEIVDAIASSLGGDSYRWRKATDVGREYALFELMRGETVLLDIGYSEDGELQIAFDPNICGKTVGWDEFVDLLREGKTLAERDR